MPYFGGITRPSAITPPFDNNNDVILFGRGYDCHTSPGNEFFRTLCSEERSSVPKKRLRPTEKSDMIHKIMTAVKSKGGRFVKESGSEWIEVTDETACLLISRRLKPSNLSPPQPNSVVIVNSKPKQHSPCCVLAPAALPSDTMETTPTTKDVNTADTTKGVKNADEGPAMNTRSKSKTINKAAGFVGTNEETVSAVDASVRTIASPMDAGGNVGTASLPPVNKGKRKLSQEEKQPASMTGETTAAAQKPKTCSFEGCFKADGHKQHLLNIEHRREESDKDARTKSGTEKQNQSVKGTLTLSHCMQIRAM
jgi:hypothetical protein